MAKWDAVRSLMLAGMTQGLEKVVTSGSLATAAVAAQASGDTVMTAGLSFTGIAAGVLSGFLVNHASEIYAAGQGAEALEHVRARNRYLRRGFVRAVERSLAAAQQELAGLDEEIYGNLFATWRNRLGVALEDDASLDALISAEIADEHWHGTSPYEDADAAAAGLASLLRERLLPETVQHTLWSGAEAMAFSRRLLPLYQQAFAHLVAEDDAGFLSRAFDLKGLQELLSLARAVSAAVPQILLKQDVMHAESLGEHQRSQAMLAELHATLAFLRSAPGEAVERQAPLWNVPSRNELFSGREAYLEALRTTLAETGTVAVTQRAARAIRGLGGLGKTQTAVEFAHRYRQDYTAAFFVVAETGTSLEAGFAAIARLVGESEQTDASLAAARARQWLEDPRHAGWLLILDNVDDVARLKGWLPERGGHLLITTRLNSVGRIAGSVELPRMAPHEGARFLLRRASLLLDDASVDWTAPHAAAALQLSEIMGGLPLALEQAGAYIVEMGSSPAEYLRFYQEEGARLLGRAGADADHDSVLLTFTLAFEQLSETAKDHVRLCAFLAPDGIPEEVLVGRKPSRSMREGVGEVVRYSLLSVREVPRDGEMRREVDIHRLVQAVVRDSMTEEARRYWADRALQAVNMTMLGADGIRSRWQSTERLLRERGIEHVIHDSSFERPWALDPTPQIFSSQEWVRLERGVAQRAALLNAVLADVYGARRFIGEEGLPEAFLSRNGSYLQPCRGANVHNGCYLQIYAADVVLTTDGRWLVLADRTQTPAGLGHVLENRAVLARVLEETIRHFEVRPLTASLDAYIDSLRQLSRPPSDQPHIVVLTPGRYNGNYFEHEFLARVIGATLAEGDELTVRHDGVYVETLGSSFKVDVIVRRINDDFCDPSELRPDSALGVPGLVQAVRKGQVSLANALGSVLAETAGLHAFLPRLCQRILGEDLRLPSIETLWCGDAASRRIVLDDVDRFSIVPAFACEVQAETRSGLEPLRRARLLEDMRADPESFVARDCTDLVKPSSRSQDDEVVRDTRVRLFAFAAGDGSYSVVPGALTTVSSSPWGTALARGGRARDTWVLGEPVPGLDAGGTRDAAPPRPRPTLSGRRASDYFWLGRYSERLESRLRIVRALLQALASDERPEALMANTLLLDLLDTGEGGGKDAAAGAPPSVDARITSAIYSGQDPNSVANLLRSLYRVSMTTRHSIGFEAWQALLDLHQALVAPPEHEAVLEHASSTLTRSLAAFSRLPDSFLRTDGDDVPWHLLMLGRCLESVSFLGRLLELGAWTFRNDSHPYLGILVEMSSLWPGELPSATADRALAVLIEDGNNPRCLARQVRRLNEHLAALPAIDAASAALSAAVAGLREYAARLDIGNAPEPGDGLPAFPLLGMDADSCLAELSTRLEEDYFRLR